jgi:hypothetical protein
MMLRVVCPQCAREIFALPQSAGKVGQCSCGEKLAVPGAPQAPARRPLSTRATALLIAAGVGVGLAAGLLPGKRSTAAPQHALAALEEDPGPANVGGPSPVTLSSPAAPALPVALEPERPLASPPPAPPTISARKLFKLYRDNPAKADELYGGRVIRVRGQVVEAPLGEEGAWVAGLVTFEAEEVPPAAYPEPVPSRAGVLLRAEPTRQGELRALVSGGAVEVEGRCAGWRPDPSVHLGAAVVLEDCRLLPSPKQ